MDRWIGKVAIVTGASSGIGKAICHKLIEQGITTLALARKTDKLEEVSKELHGKLGKFAYRVCDVRNEDEVKSAFEYAEKSLGPVHILVNAAGVWSLGFICQHKMEHAKATLDTNILGVFLCTRQAIEQMAKNQVRGQIINLNSVSGHSVPTLKPPIMGLYPATKHAIKAISESLNQEMSYCETGIKVTSLSPGFVDTEMFDNSLDSTDIKIYKSRLPQALRAEDIAEAAMYILSTPDSVLIKELTLTRNV